MEWGRRKTQRTVVNFHNMQSSLKCFAWPLLSTTRDFMCNSSFRYLVACILPRRTLCDQWTLRLEFDAVLWPVHSHCKWTYTWSARIPFIHVGLLLWGGEVKATWWCYPILYPTTQQVIAIYNNSWSRAIHEHISCSINDPVSLEILCGVSIRCLFGQPAACTFGRDDSDYDTGSMYCNCKLFASCEGSAVLG